MQLCFITTKIVSSLQRCIQFHKIAQEKYSGNELTVLLVLLMVIQDIQTQWNSTHAMIQRSLKLKEVLCTVEYNVCVLSNPPILLKAIDSWTFNMEDI